MTLEEWVLAWNDRYNDRIIPERVHCWRCKKPGPDLIVPDSIFEDIKCPVHDVYAIRTPRDANKGRPVSHGRTKRARA